MSRTVNGQPLATTTIEDAASTSVTVCELVSQVSDTPIRELPPLGRTIDADGLDEVFADRSSQGRVAFQYAGYDVVARSSDVIEVYQTETTTV